MSYLNLNIFVSFFHQIRVVQWKRAPRWKRDPATYGSQHASTATLCSSKQDCDHVNVIFSSDQSGAVEAWSSDFLVIGPASFQCATVLMNKIVTTLMSYFHQTRVAQWKRAGPITKKYMDRNHALLRFIFFLQLKNVNVPHKLFKLQNLCIFVCFLFFLQLMVEEC